MIYNLASTHPASISVSSTHVSKPVIQRLDMLTLDPEFAAAAGPILALAATASTPKLGDVKTRRANHEKLIGALARQMHNPPNVSSTPHTIKSHDGAEFTVFQYSPDSLPAHASPAIVHIHGGGMIAGSTKNFASLAAGLAASSGLQVFDVEYRLAPEHNQTSLVEDVYAALLWLHENATSFNIDTTRIGVMGESAGGGIAAGVALMARDRKLTPPLAKQILVYPMLDYQTRTVQPPSIEKYLVWSIESNMTGWGALVGKETGDLSAVSTEINGEVSQYASPAHAKDLSGLPSTYIDVGTLDLFRDEDVEYANRLIRADVDVELHLYPGVPHAFELLAPKITLTTQSAANRLRAMKSF